MNKPMFPNEVWHNIIVFIHPRYRNRIAQVCKAFKYLVSCFSYKLQYNSSVRIMGTSSRVLLIKNDHIVIKTGDTYNKINKSRFGHQMRVIYVDAIEYNGIAGLMQLQDNEYTYNRSPDFQLCVKLANLPKPRMICATVNTKMIGVLDSYIMSIPVDDQDHLQLYNFSNNKFNFIRKLKSDHVTYYDKHLYIAINQCIKIYDLKGTEISKLLDLKDYGIKSIQFMIMDPFKRLYIVERNCIKVIDKGQVIVIDKQTIPQIDFSKITHITFDMNGNPIIILSNEVLFMDLV